MNDDELVAALQALFDGAADDAGDPDDGIDRSDGYGEDYRITALRVVESPDGFDDLEVTVQAGDDTVTSRLLFDRRWREAAGLDDVASCAAYVVARWSGSVIDAEPVVVPDQVEAIVPGIEPLWRDLEVALAGSHAAVNRVRRGVLELVDEDGEIVTVHVTPHQWRAVVMRCTASGGRGVDDGRSAALAELDEQIASRWDDEEHIVFFRGRFHRSIRAELPPVRSMLLRGPGASIEGGRWQAYRPLDPS